jgi:hypothetical protein
MFPFFSFFPILHWKDMRSGPRTKR